MSRLYKMQFSLEHDALATIANLLKSYDRGDYFSYERKGVWYIGLENRASIFIDAEGKTATTVIGSPVSGVMSKREVHSVSVNDTLPDIAREFISKYSENGKIYGQVGFNYASIIRGHAYNVGRWPVLSLMAPRMEVKFKGNQVTVIGHDTDIKELCDLITLAAVTNSLAGFDRSRYISPDTEQTATQYKAHVQSALTEIQKGMYNKVIASRTVDLERPIDMPATLLLGRRSNTPARTFCFKHAGFEATGFSPELVMALENGKVVTEPLAGTRSRVQGELEKLRHELLNDSKEIVEHVISVKAAIGELETPGLCRKGSIMVEDLMAVRDRGAVQHLGSTVTGSIEKGKDGWDAFDVLFPSITASGIPKDVALEAIQRLEPRPRELYSGAVLLIEGQDFFEATLVLRTVYQDSTGARWLQAGAGVIVQSNPVRELIETREKLATIAPFLIAKIDEA